MKMSEAYHIFTTDGEMVLDRYSEVIGLPVICIEDKKILGVVKDIVFNTKQREAIAVQLERKGHEIKGRVILFKDIVSLGKDAVVVNDRGCVATQRGLEKTGCLKEKGDVLGVKIYSKTGEDLGIARDVLLNLNTGLVEGVEVSDGIYQDIVEGRQILPFVGRVEFAKDYILVEKEAVEEMKSTGGGIKKKFLGE